MEKTHFTPMRTSCLNWSQLNSRTRIDLGSCINNPIPLFFHLRLAVIYTLKKIN